ncbi:hypothetical protein GCK72_013174 [Caenorhabditis remanei]|uniref:Uncharacterized protein n=1 Tax=Caenorhabditis remanei TaxID=31234 RepID=A0A6A5GN71_CAERE|nr:hypothetical protein GCK72_013174 [Caenorhabditis remanei]KAF1756720.1 hypothetical protein GCK72_013174 [Caenorhabditis remanei]
MMMNPCVVCLARGNGKHFGVDACRGCTAFFRRTVVNKRKYKCSEDETCDIERSEGVLCKKCRFEKCLKMGMKKEAIQNHRDIYGRRNPKAILPSPSTSNPQITVSTSILSTIKRNYSQLENVRVVVHSMEGGSMFLKPAPRGQTYKETYRLLLREFYLVADWISNSFPHFTELPTNQKDILLRNFYLTFYNLEAGFFACQRNRNDVWFLPNGNFINCQNLESFYHDPNNLQSMTSADAAKLFKGTCTGCKRNVLEPMLRENVSQFEFLALAALILFDTGLEGQTDSCVDICQKVRTAVLREMIHYYSTKRVEEYPLRMANILSIIPSVQKASQKMQSDLELGHLFNAYSAEKTFFENCMGKR